MVNQKLVLETISNLTNELAQLENVVAGLAAVVESRLPGLSLSEKETLKSGISAMQKNSQNLQLAAERLQADLRGL